MSLKPPIAPTAAAGDPFAALDARLDLEELVHYVAPASTGVAATDQVNLAAAVTAAGDGVLELEEGGSYVINDALSLLTQGLTVRVNGATIRQSTWNKPVFDCQTTDDVTIEGPGLLKSTATRTDSASSFRGDDLNAYGAGVWSAGDRTTVRNIRVTGLFVGVHFTNWTTGTTHSGRPVENVATDIKVSGCDFGVLAIAQDRPHIENVTGDVVRSSGSGDPAHLVYVNGYSGTTSRDLTGGNWRCVDSTDPAYKLAQIDGGSLGNVLSRNCGGLLSYEGLIDFTITGLSAHDDARADETGAIHPSATDSVRLRMANVVVEKAVTGRAVYLEGTDCVIDGLTVVSSRSGSDANEDVKVAGTRCEINDYRHTNSQSTTTGGEGVKVYGTDCAVRTRLLRGVRNGISVDATATGATLDYDSQLITQESGFDKISNSGTGTIYLGRLSASKTWDPGSIADGAVTNTTLTVNSAKAGSAVAVGFSTAVPANSFMVGSVTSDNTVTVTLFNKTGAPLDLASGTLWADVWRH